MAGSRVPKGALNYNNQEKKEKNFTYMNLGRSNCYNCNFVNSNFDFVSFRGAHLKTCSFIKCSFIGSEFVGSNLKGSKFKNARFKDVIFEGANLDCADFKDAEYENVVFLECKLDNILNFDFGNEEITIYDEMPELEISSQLRDAVENAMSNEFIKKSRVLDTRTGSLHNLNLMILLNKFGEEAVVNGLNRIHNDIDREFFTLSYIIKLLNKYKNEVVL